MCEAECREEQHEKWPAIFWKYLHPAWNWETIKNKEELFCLLMCLFQKSNNFDSPKKNVYLTLPRQNLHPESFEQAVGTPYLKNHNIQALILPLSTASEIL